jgi:hypothetical protein
MRDESKRHVVTPSAERQSIRERSTVWCGAPGEGVNGILPVLRLVTNLTAAN